jgi:hypothetical protein
LRAKRSRPKAILAITAAAISVGALTGAPAQASASCNDGRLCWYQPDGNITNVDLDASDVPYCKSLGRWPGAIGNYLVRNRTSDSIAIHYDENGDGSIQWWNEEVARIDSEETVTLNPRSRYFYCQGYHPNP